MTANATEKKCSRCGQTKSLDQFAVMKAGKFGKRADCKECRRKWQAERYLAKTAAEGRTIQQRKIRTEATPPGTSGRVIRTNLPAQAGVDVARLGLAIRIVRLVMTSKEYDDDSQLVANVYQELAVGSMEREVEA